MIKDYLATASISIDGVNTFVSISKYSATFGGTSLAQELTTALIEELEKNGTKAYLENLFFIEKKMEELLKFFTFTLIRCKNNESIEGTVLISMPIQIIHNLKKEFES